MRMRGGVFISAVWAVATFAFAADDRPAAYEVEHGRGSSMECPMIGAPSPCMSIATAAGVLPLAGITTID